MFKICLKYDKNISDNFDFTVWLKVLFFMFESIIERN